MRQDWAHYIRQRAPAYGLDPAALLAVSLWEGLSGRPGDNGHAFGPFQLNDAGGVITGRPGNHRAFAESPQGIEFALQQIAHHAKGLKGELAIEAIVRQFERPADPDKEIARAKASYARFAGGAGLGGGTPAAPAGGQAAAMMPSLEPQARAQFASTIINNIGHHGPPDYGALVGALQGLQQARKQQQMVQAAPAPVQPHAQAIVKGAYAFPVAGASNFTDTWGAYRGDQPNHFHYGIDVFAKRGTPVVAITDGVVSKMGPSAIGGNRVWINGKFYYAHLDGFAPGLKPGARVHKGQVIGYVGDTGDAKGTPTHLHFGFSPNGSQGASWANPYKLLKSLYG